MFSFSEIINISEDQSKHFIIISAHVVVSEKWPIFTEYEKSSHYGHTGQSLNFYFQNEVRSSILNDRSRYGSIYYHSTLRTGPYLPIYLIEF